ncbi:hypothetical protein RAMDARK_1701 [Rickettsia amblyommatis str. Darkwater]|uniref:Uncharacterized protein n=1 Tax=Rickettsia amblyommatis str. Ac/Pa TaxID=1359164 RepID=A0A0F3N5R8_RICAM|nr:hypothetical protein APHACPA_1260 [Rickettsia amblyommatis str. Ac/Pa]KJV93275.1 hypothetical protein RAMDARK_0934 [Rickettsia amblyommatis str. Darkwater]KJV99995.1 hypothetical protein RAMDARK_1701 [Rickettsia amblyommatis str. Darkwater]
MFLKIQKVLQNVEKVLEDAPQNEETLEIGINAALLNLRNMQTNSVRKNKKKFLQMILERLMTQRI